MKILHNWHAVVLNNSENRTEKLCNELFMETIFQVSFVITQKNYTR